MLLGINIFSAQETSQVLERVTKMEMPDFKEFSPEINDELANILKKSLTRDANERYQQASAMLVDLERYIYSGGYGPTSETLAEYIREFLDVRSFPHKTSGGTTLLR
jgi:hypothetical protein